MYQLEPNMYEYVAPWHKDTLPPDPLKNGHASTFETTFAQRRFIGQPVCAEELLTSIPFIIGAIDYVYIYN